MRSAEYILKYAVLQAVMHACCDLMEEESNAIIAKLPESQRDHASVQVTLYDEDNKTAQLWHQANAEQRQLIRDWENR